MAQFRTRGSARSALQSALRNVRKKTVAALKAAPVNDLSQPAQGTITFPANPVANATITLGGTVVTFGTNVTVGANLAATLSNLLTYLKASADANLVKASYSVSGSALQIKYKTLGVATFPLAASAATVSGSTLKFVQIQQRPKL